MLDETEHKVVHDVSFWRVVFRPWLHDVYADVVGKVKVGFDLTKHGVGDQDVLRRYRGCWFRPMYSCILCVSMGGQDLHGSSLFRYHLAIYTFVIHTYLIAQSALVFLRNPTIICNLCYRLEENVCQYTLRYPDQSL